MSLYNYKVGDCLTISAKANVFTINIEILEINQNYIRVKDLNTLVEYNITSDFQEQYYYIERYVNIIDLHAHIKKILICLKKEPL